MAPINAHDQEGWTPLHAAVHWEQKDAIKLLAEGGADFEAVTFRGELCTELTETQELKTYVEGLLLFLFFFSLVNL